MIFFSYKFKNSEFICLKINKRGKITLIDYITIQTDHKVSANVHVSHKVLSTCKFLFLSIMLRANQALQIYYRKMEFINGLTFQSKLDCQCFTVLNLTLLHVFKWQEVT